MSTRKEILDTLVEEIKKENIFKDVYVGVIPAWAYIKNTPSIAIAIDKEERQRHEIPGYKFQNNLQIVLMIYNEGKNGEYEDIISDLVEKVEDIINYSKPLQDMVVDIYVSQVKHDGGILHPKALAEIEVQVSYLR